MKLHEYSSYDATGLAELVRRREVTAGELVRLAREAHDQINPTINAVIEFYEDAESVPCSDAGPFGGVPFLRKDISATEAGRLYECGSRLYQGFRPTVDSYFVERARAGGLRIVGRTTTTELGVSGLSETALCGITRNPWNLGRTVGGSSSGSGAAVASGIVPIASASDGGGSTRIPAAYCGLVGFNPSRGRISGGPSRQDSGIGISRSFVLCRTVRDMAAALDVLSGSYPGDAFLIPRPERPYVEELSRPSGRLKIGVALSSWAELKLDPEIRDRVAETAKVLEEMGHVVQEIDPPFSASDYREVIGGSTYLGYASLDVEASALGRKVDGSTLEPLNLLIYERAKHFPLSYAEKVFEHARKVRFDVGKAVQDFDILLTPTMPCTALPHDTHSTKDISEDEYLTLDAVGFCQYIGIFSVTGQPSVSLPLFWSTEGLPIGIQIVGRFADEATVVRVARDLEQAIPWAKRRPPVFAG
ncbi:amidase [Mesorhizobium sp. YC-39]|uniref:amidase n=1 Tax=unclassified Mesorhizobium TaxID=325217 RepID=UPI0021E7FD44|nr:MULTISPECIES: amidase [unclassified Mesorhizobium]MCV3211851.1 amidase [Mesorhizobium sp. YC-2]MCV3233574.1 amidase [Mesorhizobium sp. YC-39]